MEGFESKGRAAIARRFFLAGAGAAAGLAVLAPYAGRAQDRSTEGKGNSICRLWHPPGVTEFRVKRNGAEIGRHRVVFDRLGGDYFVRTDIDIEVTLLGQALFRFTHRAEELWVDGWLNGLNSDTDDDGKIHSIRAARNEVGIFEVLADGRHKRTVAGYIVPTSLWHRDTIHSQVLFDTIDGHVKLINIARLGPRRVWFGGEMVEAEGYALTGQIQRQVWYDPGCRLVRVAFSARDGSDIVLEG